MQEGTTTEVRHMEKTIAENQADSIQKKLKEILPPSSHECQEACSVRNLLDQVSNKWYMLSLLILGQHGKLRFNELKKQIGNISQRMLTVTLRAQEEDGLIKRKVYAEVPPRVEYELTEMGEGFLVQVLSLTEWIHNHRGNIAAARERYQKK